MLALDDAGLARLCIGATRIPRRADGNAAGHCPQARSATASTPHERRKQRRHAARQRAGVATCTVEYNAEVLDTLIALHWVSEQKASDRGAVGQAISAARCKSGMQRCLWGARRIYWNEVRHHYTVILACAR